MTNDDIAELVLADAERRDALYAAAADWLNGTADGGPNGDGMYPVPIGQGTTRLVPSPDRIAFLATKLDPVRRVATGNTITLAIEDHGKTIVCAGNTATQNINVQVPGNALPGWCAILVQEGTGGPRVTVTVGATAVGESGFLRSFGSVFRLAGENAEAVVKCTSRDRSFRSRMLLSGNIVQ